MIEIYKKKYIVYLYIYVNSKKIWSCSVKFEHIETRKCVVPTQGKKKFDEVMHGIFINLENVEMVVKGFIQH